MKKLTALFLMAALLAACNTMEGMGQDISAGGNALSRSASQHK